MSIKTSITRWRRNNRRRLNRLLSRLLGATRPRRGALAADTRRVLVVRLNRRLGNILFLTPMLRSLAAGLPEATIDVLVADAAHEKLLQSLPGVARVWAQPVLGVIGAVRCVRAQRYDLAIDPSTNSTSNRIALALCGARQRLGFAAERQWLALSHAGVPPTARHPAIQAVELIRDAVSQPRFEYIDTLAVYPDAAARAAGRQRWQALFRGHPARGPTVGFFAQATGGKQFEQRWWRTWRSAMRAALPAATLIQICPPGIDALDPTQASVAIGALDELAAFVAHIDVFVAADSGPMHLAAAAGVPVVGLFRATSPAAYAALGDRCVSLAGADLAPAAVAKSVCGILGQHRIKKDRPCL